MLFMLPIRIPMKIMLQLNLSSWNLFGEKVSHEGTSTKRCQIYFLISLVD